MIMSDIREDVATALRYRRSGRSDRAEPTYRSIIETDPGCAEALHLLGVVEAQVAPILPAFRPCVEAFGDDALPPGGEGR